jgi:pimeloyl-ACP methyl ester carboxylesterase
MRGRLAIAVQVLAIITCAAADGDDPHRQPVKVVAPERVAVVTPRGTAQLPVYLSADWSKPQPGIGRAVLIFHGALRNADGYYRNGQKAVQQAGSAGGGVFLIAPQFLTAFDIAAHDLGADTAAWDREAWMGGAPALTPVPVSSFEAIDAILARLADRALFPNLSQVVIAGHSGGGQVVQRYAVVGKGASTLERLGVHVRYVVANPSSYLYFTGDRPSTDGRFGVFADAAACPQFDDWKYGFAHGVPPYVGTSPAVLEARYARRDVVYLLGSRDVDPDHPLLDKTCMGEAQGPFRLARGHAYFAQLQARLGAQLQQRTFDVPGVGHDGGKMFASACGLYALFDKPGCVAP